MPNFQFSPGRFSPVVEIVAPESATDFYDHSVDTEFQEPTFNSSGNGRLTLLSDNVPNCFEDSVLDSSIPVCEPTREVVLSTGSIISVEAKDVYGCACFLTNFNVLTIPDKRSNVEALEGHSCETCQMCTSVRNPWYNFHVWLAPTGRPLRPGHSLLLAGDLLPRHPSFEGFRFLAPHSKPNPWIDKFKSDAKEVHLEFPALSRDWLIRRRRYRDCPS